VVAVFTTTGSINQAAKANGICHALARRLLVDKGLVSKDRQPYGKAAARVRFLELLESGWTAARAAREVGVHERTARDWRDGIRKIGNTRIRPDGTVIEYTRSSRYTQPVKTSALPRTAPVISSRYLSLADRLAIADGVGANQTLTAIAAGIGKHTSTVSREIRDRSIGGLYLPHQAHAAAAAARARPKQSKLVTNQKLRQAVEDGLSQRWSPEEISHRLVKDFPDDESMRVSHETIYRRCTSRPAAASNVKWPKHFDQDAPAANRTAHRINAPIVSSTR
jgi:IS30 family transposase